MAGIILLGIPHGAADLLISMKSANDKKSLFSYYKFFFLYLGRLGAFLLLLLFLPSVGIIIFIVFASFHFGETDLYKFDTHTFKGKLMSFGYGLAIVSVIVLVHFDKASSLLILFKSGRDNINLISYIKNYKLIILSFSLLFFFITALSYSSITRANTIFTWNFIFTFTSTVIILYTLPLFLGFTFYFILWHSATSLRNITIYLQTDCNFSMNNFIKQISLYSIIAIIGIMLFGIAGFMFLSHDTLIIYIILSLAVLTAPHIQVMHSMYYDIRINDRLDTINKIN
ncbi:Brp/Blh family beta-carotene 15,15'-dioxygenase [Mucilaginibacter aurantiaciroseus]|uniref:Brp/Blh family beta-carotene 15,15'-dioxygenase n=1 Tax=Mucilaginibacter aurantiaciroseus TaxID=2949308 RepID=UPI00351773BD